MVDTVMTHAAKTQEELKELKENQEFQQQTQVVHEGMLRSMKDIQEARGYEIQKMNDKLDQGLKQTQSQFSAMNDRFAAQFSSFEDKMMAQMVALSNKMDQGASSHNISPDFAKSRSVEGLFSRPVPYTVASASTIPRSSGEISLDHQGPMRLLKLEVPRFSGEDVQGWIFKANQYYDYYSIVQEQRLLISTFHLEGTALHWFRGMKIQNVVKTWGEFLEALRDRFGPSDYEDPLGKLLKLVQQTSLEDYTTQFETLMSKCDDIPESVLITAFTLQTEVRLIKPVSIAKAFGLAKAYKEKFQDMKGPVRTWGDSRGFQKPSWNFNTRSISSGVRALPALPAPPTNNPGSFINRATGLPIKRLNASEMQARRDKGLYCNCDERFTMGHKCKPQLFVIVVLEETESEEPGLDTG